MHNSSNCTSFRAVKPGCRLDAAGQKINDLNTAEFLTPSFVYICVNPSLACGRLRYQVAQ